MAKRNDDEMGKVCPECGCNVFDVDSCGHCLTVLCDDSDLTDAVAPLFFGTGIMEDQFDGLFRVVVEFATRWRRADEGQRTVIRGLIDAATADVRGLLREVITLLDDPVALSEREWYGSDDEWVERAVCFDRVNFVGLFYRLFAEQPSAIDSEGWRVDGEMVSWSGTTFWASDALACEAGIVKRVDGVVEEVRALLR